MRWVRSGRCCWLAGRGQDGTRMPSITALGQACAWPILGFAAAVAHVAAHRSRGPWEGFSRPGLISKWLLSAVRGFPQGEVFLSPVPSEVSGAKQGLHFPAWAHAAETGQGYCNGLFWALVRAFAVTWPHIGQFGGVPCCRCCVFRQQAQSAHGWSLSPLRY